MSDQSLFDRADAELRKAADRVTETLKTLVPPAVSEHLGNSQREFFLALRSFCDAALARTEEGIRDARERMKPSGEGDPRPPATG
jgi:hypothetical protein